MKLNLFNGKYGIKLNMSLYSQIKDLMDGRLAEVLSDESIPKCERLANYAVELRNIHGSIQKVEEQYRRYRLPTHKIYCPECQDRIAKKKSRGKGSSRGSSKNSRKSSSSSSGSSSKLPPPPPSYIDSEKK